jgi:O-antigen/teichoic acid export membrane protein
MGAELPALSAVVARLPNPEINLAAYGGIVFPLALIIESPVIMLLAASTALSKDYASYQLIRRFMMISGASLTVLHFLIAFTPLYYFVVESILGAPAEIIEPGRIGLMLMIPWTWSIAYRRFNQGVLIRYNHSKKVGIGTVVRLSADLIVLLIGYSIGTVQGIVVATCAVSAGVISEAVYSGIVVRPVVEKQVKKMPVIDPPLTWQKFRKFYTPLVFTSLLTLLVQPLGSAALGRMPVALPSLAVWPVIAGFTFMFRSIGIAYNEVVVALLDEPLSTQRLRRFTVLLVGLTTALIILIALTPLSLIWFQVFSGLTPELAGMAIIALLIAIPTPGLAVLQSWFQGILLHGGRTRAITEAVVVFLVTCTALLWAGVTRGQIIGLYWGIAAFTISMLIQTIWLWIRSRPDERNIQQRDDNFSLQTQLERATH